MTKSADDLFSKAFESAQVRKVDDVLIIKLEFVIRVDPSQNVWCEKSLPLLLFGEASRSTWTELNLLCSVEAAISSVANTHILESVVGPLFLAQPKQWRSEPAAEAQTPIASGLHDSSMTTGRF